MEVVIIKWNFQWCIQGLKDTLVWKEEQKFALYNSGCGLLELQFSVHKALNFVKQKGVLCSLTIFVSIATDSEQTFNFLSCGWTFVIYLTII